MIGRIIAPMGDDGFRNSLYKGGGYPLYMATSFLIIQSSTAGNHQQLQTSSPRDVDIPPGLQQRAEKLRWLPDSWSLEAFNC